MKPFAHRRSHRDFTGLFVAAVSMIIAFLILPGCPFGSENGGGGMIGLGEIGSPCEGADCKEGLTCFRGVTGGYCTVECDDDRCPPESECSSMGGIDFCLFSCSSDGDCREGYACEHGVCRMQCASRSECPANENCQGGVCVADGVGAPCEHSNDCQRGMVCQRSMPDGYCTFDCSSDPCPTGTTCGTYGGASHCFDDCDDDDDCRSGYVCSSGVCNLPCTDDAECAAGEVCVGRRCDGAGVGAPCETGPDCEGDLTCYRGVSQGYCSERCTDDDDCPLGSVCGNFKGELWCLAACRSQTDCGSGLGCFDGGCSAPCTSDDDCVDGFCDTSTGICRGGGLEVLDFGDVNPGHTIEFEADSMVHAFSVVIHGHPNVTYYASSVTNPSGRNLVGHDVFGPPLRLYPLDGAFAVQVPNSDSSDLEVTEGTWRVRIESYGGSSPARVTVLLRRTPDGLDRDGSLALEVFIAPGGLGTGVDASNAENSSYVQGVFSRFQTYFENHAGLEIGSLNFNDLPSSFSHIANEAHYKDMFKSYSKDDALNLFHVRSITLGGHSGVAGVSGGIPGPPRLGGTENSGAVIEDMNNSRHVGDGISHEAGHFMGLFHIEELDGRTSDLISDTPSCHDLNNCPTGWRNLMFPSLTGVMDNITPGQALVVRAFGGVD